MIEKQEILTNSGTTDAVQTKLSGFNDYREFLSFSKSLFQLKTEELGDQREKKAIAAEVLTKILGSL